MHAAEVPRDEIRPSCLCMHTSSRIEALYTPQLGRVHQVTIEISRAL